MEEASSRVPLRAGHQLSSVTPVEKSVVHFRLSFSASELAAEELRKRVELTAPMMTTFFSSLDMADG